jgi:transaldolase
MITEGLKHAGIASNIVVKLPSTLEGLKACRHLSDKNIRTNMTLCFQSLQALMVAKAGAFLVSPFIGRLDDVGEDGMELIRTIRAIYDNYGLKTLVLAASVRHTNHLLHCALAGADAATCPLNVIQATMKHPLTDQGIEGFLADYKKAFG